MNIKTEFETGTIITNSTLEETGNVNFVPHKTFKGVSLKLLVGGCKTDNAVSLHLVCIEPHCSLETHEHPQNLETHIVISGNGHVAIGDNSGKYEIGTVGVIPMGMPHKVTAGENGLYILATFSPALI